MTFEEAIQTAIELEKKVQGVYARASHETKDPVGKKVFGLLAQEESSHVKFLEKYLAQWTKNGKIQVDLLSSALPDKDAIEKETANLSEKLRGNDSDKELTLLHRARDVENETSSFYQQAASSLDGEARVFFSRFVEIETGHLALVQAEINSIEKMGFWFDMPEFNLENG